MATAQMVDVLVDRLPLVCSAVLVLLVTVATQYLLKADPLAAFPFAGEGLHSEKKRREAYLVNGKSIYMQGYRKFKETVFKITTATNKDVVVVPIKYLDELKRLPDDVLSFDGAIAELMANDYTKLVTGDQTIPHVVKSSLTPALAKINPILTEEVARAVRSEISACPDWTEVNIYEKTLRIVAIVSGRIFLGPELCHDERYIEAAINYTLDVFAARAAITKISPWLRPFRAPFLAEVAQLRRREDDFDDIIRPIVRARLDAERTDPGGYVKPDDMLQWLLDGKAKEAAAKGVELPDDRYLAKMQLGISLAAIHTTSMMVTNAFYDLAAYPGVLAELREECSTVLAAHGGVFTSPALQSLKKLDSCLKETTRMNPPVFAAFMRKVLKPIVLSNGQTIPAGVTLEVAAYPQSRDPEPYPEPERWDGLRFYRMREAGEDFNNTDRSTSTAVQANAHNQLVSVSHRSLSFGYGRHACPGRFFAANEIKMIVARCLLEYDIKLPDGVSERFPNHEVAGGNIPDPTKSLLFREAR